MYVLFFLQNEINQLKYFEPNNCLPIHFDYWHIILLGIKRYIIMDRSGLWPVQSKFVSYFKESLYPDKSTLRMNESNKYQTWTPGHSRGSLSKPPSRTCPESHYLIAILFASTLASNAIHVYCLTQGQLAVLSLNSSMTFFCWNSS